VCVLPPLVQYVAHLGLPSAAAPSHPYTHDPADSVPEGGLIGGTIRLVSAVGAYGDARLIDAPLTPKGQAQARGAHIEVRTLGIDLVLSTPLTRAVQTSLLVFRPKANTIDWSAASIPSIDQPLLNPAHGGAHAADAAVALYAPAEVHPPIRIIPYHVENLCASCDMGVPLSVLAARFAQEPNLDFKAAETMMPDLWWAGATQGGNVEHLAESSPASVSGESARTVPASASGASALASSYVFRPSESMYRTPLRIVREQSSAIEARTARLLQYLLDLAVEHAASEHAHRPIRIALVGHCGKLDAHGGRTRAREDTSPLDARSTPRPERDRIHR
jgi:hypothetical protein